MVLVRAQVVDAGRQCLGVGEVKVTLKVPCSGLSDLVSKDQVDELEGLEDRDVCVCVIVESKAISPAAPI